MSDVEGKPDTLRVRIRTERGFDKEYDLLEDKILARFQKKREDVKSVNVVRQYWRITLHRAGCGKSISPSHWKRLSIHRV